MTARIGIGFALCILVPLAGSATRLSAQDAAAARPARPDADVITREQVNSSVQRTAWDIVQAVHPNWLRQRPGSRSAGPLTRPASDSSSGRPGAAMPFPSPPSNDDASRDGTTGILVYLDGMRMGNLEELRNIPAAQVYAIRRYGGSEAQFRFGNGNAGGVLAVSTHPEDRR